MTIDTYEDWDDRICGSCGSSFIGKEISLENLGEEMVSYLDFYYLSNTCPVCGYRVEKE